MTAGQRTRVRGPYGLRGFGTAGRPPGPARSPITPLPYIEDRLEGETCAGKAARGGTRFGVTVGWETPATREESDHRGARPLLGGLVGYGLPWRRAPVPGR